MEARVDEQPRAALAFPPSLRAGLQLLVTSALYAEELDRDIWDFSVEASRLRAAGLSNSDLRWLVCKEYVQHAREITLPGEMRRSFRGHGGLLFFKRSCFVLTPAGRAAAEAELAPRPRISSAMAAPSAELENAVAAYARRPNGQKPKATPHWDGDRHQFRVNGVLVKEFKVHSPNQETVLAAFQEEGWPPRIDDPLPPHAEIDPKRRLHDTIKSLNRNQKNRLIQFMGDGSGEAVRWEPINAARGRAAK
jgi:hypothetical protein